jgi:hypothetical protein
MKVLLVLLFSRLPGKRPPPWYYRCKHWVDFMAVLRAERGFRCECCHGKGWNGHHSTYLRVGKEKKSDIFLLCERCHSCVHGFRTLLVPRFLLGRMLHG